MKSRTDRAIWREFKNEKGNALSFIYHENVDFLFFYGKKFSTDEDLILDVIQDLFFYLIQKRKSLGDTDNVRLYLLKAFRRRLFDEIKKKDKQDELKHYYSTEPTITFSAEDKLIVDEQLSEQNLELKRGLQKLNSQQREVLYYRFTCDFDYEQICEIMSISYDSARQIVSRSVKILKQYLTRKGLILMIFFRRYFF